MQGISRRQIVPAVNYQEELRRIEAAKRFVVQVKTTGAVLTTPLTKIQAEHFIADQRPHSDRLELVEVAA